MKDIKRIVSEMGLELSDEQQTQLDEQVRENYVTRAELDEKVERIEALTTQVGSFKEQLEGQADASEQIEALKSQISEYEEAERNRVQAEADKKAFDSFTAEFDKELADKQFSNSITRDTVLQQAYDKQTANPDMKLSDIIKGLTDDVDGIWANPQQPARKMPLSTDENKQAELGNFARQLFGSREK